MDVINSNRKFKVYWMYNNSMLPDFLHHALSICTAEEMQQMERMPLKKQVEFWNEKCPDSKIPEQGDIDRDRTWCFIVEDGKVIAEAFVMRFHKDTDDRDKARKYSLAKALKTLYPELTDKAARTLFWEKYLGRCPVTEMKAVKGGVIPVRVGNRGGVMTAPMDDVNK